MTDDDARNLAQRCIDTWPAGPKAYVWRDLLAPLELGPATVAYRKLAIDADKTPTPGQFMARYNAQMRPAEPRIVGADPNGIGLGEYLERLQLRATKGNLEAQTELDRWHRHLTGRSKYSHRRTPDTDDAA